MLEYIAYAFGLVYTKAILRAVYAIFFYLEPNPSKRNFDRYNPGILAEAVMPAALPNLSV